MRYLQTLNSISAENNSTIIFPVTILLIITSSSHIKKAKKALQNKFINSSYHQVPIDIMSQLMGNSPHPSPHQVCLQFTTALMKIVQLCNFHQDDAKFHDDAFKWKLQQRWQSHEKFMNKLTLSPHLLRPHWLSNPTPKTRENFSHCSRSVSILVDIWPLIPLNAQPCIGSRKIYCNHMINPNKKWRKINWERIFQDIPITGLATLKKRGGGVHCLF